MQNDIHYYYIRRPESTDLIACVAITQNDDKTVNRGISICSENERFDKEKARTKSRGRLTCALTKKSDNLPIRQNIDKKNLQDYCDYVKNIDPDNKFGLLYKAGYSNIATTMEERMFNKPE